MCVSESSSQIRGARPPPSSERVGHSCRHARFGLIWYTPDPRQQAFHCPALPLPSSVYTRVPLRWRCRVARVPCRAVPCRVMSCHAVSCRTVPYRVVSASRRLGGSAARRLGGRRRGSRGRGDDASYAPSDLVLRVWRSGFAAGRKRDGVSGVSGICWP